MHLMAATETVLFGEIFAGDGQRGDTAARVGHQMLEDWVRSSPLVHRCVGFCAEVCVQAAWTCAHIRIVEPYALCCGVGRLVLNRSTTPKELGFTNSTLQPTHTCNSRACTPDIFTPPTRPLARTSSMRSTSFGYAMNAILLVAAYSWRITSGRGALCVVRCVGNDVCQCVRWHVVGTAQSGLRHSSWTWHAQHRNVRHSCCFESHCVHGATVTESVISPHRYACAKCMYVCMDGWMSCMIGTFMHSRI